MQPREGTACSLGRVRHAAHRQMQPREVTACSLGRVQHARVRHHGRVRHQAHRQMQPFSTLEPTGRRMPVFGQQIGREDKAVMGVCTSHTQATTLCALRLLTPHSTPLLQHLPSHPPSPHARPSLMQPHSPGAPHPTTHAWPPHTHSRTHTAQHTSRVLQTQWVHTCSEADWYGKAA